MTAFAEAVIANAKIGGPAHKAGLRGGDRITSIGGTPVASVSDLRKVVMAHPDTTLAVTWERGGEAFASQVHTRNVEGRGMIEVDFRTDKRHLGLGASFVRGFEYSAWAAGQFFAVLRSLATFKMTRDMVGGPVRIGMIAGEALRWSVVFFLNLLVYFSAQLAMINLFPIPVLDGGHLLLLGVETARRRPISLRDRMIAQQIGFAVLVGMFLALTYNDIYSLIFKH
jgi:regulator of sigma E protease